MSKIDEIEARRAQRKAQARAIVEEQRVRDIEALDSLEVEHGDHNVAAVELSYPVPGAPTLCVVRCPKPTELKRWQDRVKPRKGKDPDNARAIEELAGPCTLYPDADTLKALLTERYGLKAQLGLAALRLHDAQVEEQGKD